MKSFIFYQDYDITITKRDYYTIQAKSLEEARQMVRDADYNLYDINPNNATYIRTEELMSEYWGNVHTITDIYDSEDERVD